MAIIIIGLLCLLAVALLAFLIVAKWKMFAKAGKPGWMSLVPFYNIVVVMEMAGMSAYYALLMLVPIVNLVFAFKAHIRIAKLFGKSTGFGVGTVLLPFIFIPILAFGKAKYSGEAKASHFSVLLKHAVSDYKNRFKSILAFSAISILSGILMSGFMAAGVVIAATNVAVGVAVGAIGFIGCLIAAYLTSGAFTYAMKDGAKIKESFGYIFKNFWSFLWIMVLTGLAVIPGLTAFLVPGLFLAVIFSFSMFALMDEGLKGTKALMRSKEYIQKSFWPIVGNFSLYMLVIMCVAMVVSIAGSVITLGNQALSSFIQSLFNGFVVVPAGLCFSWRLYKDNKAKHGDIGPVSEKRGWIKALAIVGVAIIVALTVLLAVFMPKIISGLQSLDAGSGNADDSEFNLDEGDFNFDSFPTDSSSDL